MTFEAERLTGIGGSDAAAVLGISAWATPYDCYRAKTGQAPPFIENEAMIWGQLLEPLIRQEYTRRTGRFVEETPMLRHPVHDHMICHLDGRVDKKRILEIKTARVAQGWGEPGTSEVPLQYLAQVHHNLVVAGADVCDIPVLIGGSDFRIYEVHADEEIARELVKAESEFWFRVQHRDPPGPTNLRDALSRWGRLTAEGTVIATESELLAIERLREMRVLRKQIDSATEKAQLAIMAALGERGDCLVNDSGVLLATWRLDKGVKAYEVAAKPPTRRFLLKGE